jgi:multidrug resistance efflux pump
LVIALLLTVSFVFVAWLVFFRFKWLTWSIPWAVFSGFFGAHLLLIFLIGVRFTAPYTTNAHVIQPTIQLVPRLPEPTLVTAVLVASNAAVKKGQPLFQFDRRPYQYSVDTAQANLATALQNPAMLGSDVASAAQSVAQAKSALAYARDQERTMRGPEVGRPGEGGRSRPAAGAGGARSRARAQQREGRRRLRERRLGAGPARPGPLLPREHHARLARGWPNREPAGPPRDGRGDRSSGRDRVTDL